MNFAARKFLSASHRERVSTGGEVANALVCKTSIRRFNPGPVLQYTSVSHNPAYQS